jgi:hypothetical protein
MMTVAQNLDPGILSVLPASATVVLDQPKKESPLARQIRVISKEILNAKSTEEVSPILTKNLVPWGFIKGEMVHNLLNKKFTIQNYAAACNLSLGEMGDMISEGKGKKKLGSDAEMALRMALDTMTRCNRLFIERLMMAMEQVKRTQPAAPVLSITPLPKFVNYIRLIPRIEMVLCAISSYIEGGIRPKKPPFVDDLACLVQSWTEELSVIAATIGLEQPTCPTEPLDDQTTEPQDKNEAAFGETIWTEANKAFKAEETSRT